MGKIYECFKKAEKPAPRDSFTDKTALVKFELDGKNYEIFFPRRRANRYSIIHCNNNTIEWEQFPVMPRITGRYHGVREPLVSLSPIKSSVRIFVVMGKPNSIAGLDEGIFRSVHKYSEDHINVMSEARFKEI